MYFKYILQRSCFFAAPWLGGRHHPVVPFSCGGIVVLQHYASHLGCLYAVRTAM